LWLEKNWKDKVQIKEERKKVMSKKYPECPLYNHSSCKERDNPFVCAIVRDDKMCLKKGDKRPLKK